jgi:predicted nuclease with TOPRIM domain
MKNKMWTLLLAGILVLSFLASSMLVPDTKALAFNYSDSTFFNNLSTTSSPDVVKPEGVVTVNITGKLAVNQSLIFSVSFYVATASQPSSLIGSTNMVLNSAVATVTNYPIIVPSNALNNAYVYATISNGTTTFSKILISLVQNPTYSELQALYNQLQTNMTNLKAEVTILQTQLDSANSNSTSLQNQLTNLNSTYRTLLANYTSLVSNSTSDKSALLSQISVLENQLSSLNSTNAALQSQLAGLQSQLNGAQTNNTSLSSQVAILKGNNSALQTQVNNLQADKDSLLNQTASLQNQVSRLQFNSTNLQTMVDNLSNQTSTLHLQVNDLQSKNSTTSILMYLATFVAVAFIVATAYIILIVVKRKGKETVETPLY